MENHIIPYYQLSAEETLQNVKTAESGLSQKEAKNRLKIYGKNKLQTASGELLIFKFLRQFKDLMVVILIVAGSLALYLHEYRDAVIMYAIVIINAVIGFLQEFKAEKVMDSLKTLVKAHAKVIRENKEIEIEGEELVPGDIVRLEEGDAIPADLRILRENMLGTNDFALTGESNPSRKFTHAIKGEVQLGDRNNIAFMGTTVATGNAIGVVVGTGMQTEIGHIAHLSQETVSGLSPLQKELNNLAKNITIITLTIGAILFTTGLVLHFSVREAFLFALGVAAACVPEGLPAQVSIALSLAAGRLAKKKAVVKKLSAVETLGSTHIICTDKTGTLTTNAMTVEKFFIGNMVFTVTGVGYQPEGHILNEKGQPLSKTELEKYQLFFENGLFASNAKVNPPDAEHPGWYSIGDPTEAALLTLAAKAGLDWAAIYKKYPEIKEFPFDAVRKRMSSIREKDGKILAYVKGAPESVLNCCARIWDNGIIRALNDNDRQFVKGMDDKNAAMALRNLGYAYREINVNKTVSGLKMTEEQIKNIKMETAEQELIWLGMVAMLDPPREEVAEAMETALKAKIRVIMITGDYALTAKAIANKIGLNKGQKDQTITVINGEELQGFSDIELLHKLIHSNLIFSRTSPEDKLRIVSLLKKAGEIVAVTGDGVNDTPALKKANIGVAMGKTGTEVAKNSAEIVLLDDSFGTLVAAIKEGRVIFQNLKKTIMSSLTSNGGELFAVLLSLAGTAIFNFPLAILAVQILLIDLVGEMLPLTFLTWDSAQPRIMSESPRNPDEHIMNRHNLIDLSWTGFTMGMIGYINFLAIFFREGVNPIGIRTDSPLYTRATTMTYISIVLVQWMNILSRRAGSQESVLSAYLWSNKRLLIGYAVSLFFLFNIVYNPWLAPFTRTRPLTVIDWFYAIIGAIIYLFIREIYKVIRKKKVRENEDVYSAEEANMK